METIMTAIPRYKTGDKIIFRGIIAEVFNVRIHDRETPSEHVEYDVEQIDGMVLRVREDEIRAFQTSLF
jgi:ASC-1-like (ASCH) protein